MSVPRSPAKGRIGAKSSIFRNRPFVLFWLGVMLSQIGVRATLAANLYHVYVISGSTLSTGLIGLAQGATIILIAPFAGLVVDRVNRKRLLQTAQVVSLLVSLSLGLQSLLADVMVWHVLVAVILNSAAVAFEVPARQALIPAVVERGRLVEAFVLIQTSNKIATLIGPAIAGLIIAVSGPGLVYLLDAATYGLLGIVLLLLKIPHLPGITSQGLLLDLRHGFEACFRRPIIAQLIALDVTAMFFGAYRVLLPAIALETLGVGPEGYGVLSAAPALGALIGSALMFSLVRRAPAGLLTLLGTGLYGLVVMSFGHFRMFLAAITAALLLGFFESMSTAIRLSALQIETPDELRGRAFSIYMMFARGGSAFGDLHLGVLASFLGPAVALTVAGSAPVILSIAMWLSGARVAGYRLPSPGVDMSDPSPSVAVARGTVTSPS